MKTLYITIPVRKLMVLFIVFFTTPQVIAANQQTQFPGRRLYPDVPIIELESFYTKLRTNNVIVVDVRSSYEYKTLRIDSSHNIPIASSKFLQKLAKLMNTDPRQVVFYCNGKTCMKSYQAARKAIKSKLDNVIAYDAGIMDFAHAYPNATLLFDKPLHDTKKLISKQEFTQHLISPEAFENRIAAGSNILLDIRERIQRSDGISLYIGREHRVTLDNKRRLDRYIDQAKQEKKTLLVYDAAGKQVRWLQYYLESKSLSDYYFMDGGITAYYQNLRKQ